MQAVLGIFLFVSIARAKFHAWCNLKEFGCGRILNTMCLYDESPFKHECLNMVDGMAQEDWIRKYWLALINSFRDQVAGGNFENWPKAANMKQLVWDNMLEAQARRWNFQCVLERSDDCNRNFNYEASQIGQIQSYIRGVKDQNFMSRVKQLFASTVNSGMNIQHVKDLIEQGISQDSLQDGGPTAAMPNLLFADSEHVGASLLVSGWEAESKPNIMRSNTYTAPISNGSAVYQQGSPCSKCPTGWFCKSRGSYPNLCAKSNYPRYDERVDINSDLEKSQTSTPLLTLAVMIPFVPSKPF